MRTLTALRLVLCSATGAHAQCHPPQYQAGATFADSASVLVRNISIPLRGFAPGKLVCLAASLKERYRDRTTIMVNIFSSYEAASRSIVQQEYSKEDLETFAQMHARYIFDASKHEEHLDILPVGDTPSLRGGLYSTRIDLPVATTPHCRLQINNRCLIALEDVTYPYEALRQKTSGAVTLTGTITRDGQVKHVHVMRTESGLAKENNLLTHAAVKNLSSWQIEPGSHKDAIQITYSYAIDNSIPHGVRTQVQWALPNEVAIRGNPHE